MVNRTTGKGPVDDGDHSHRLALKSSQGESRVAELLRHRRSTKSYRPDRIGVETLSRLLSTSVGTAPDARRPYGSAHARYDIVVTVVASAVDGLAPAAYRYVPTEHSLVHLEEGDHRSCLAGATLDADWLTKCPVVLMLSTDVAAANDAFEAQGPGRGERFCWFEAGLIAQNIYLWAAENAIGTVFLGGVDSDRMQSAAQRLIPSRHTVLGVLPLGQPAGEVTSKL